MYNRYIRVNDEYGQRKLLVNGSPQSGRYVRSLWKHAFKAFDISKSRQWNNILVLGVGGGTVIHMLRYLFPDAGIIGIDIDSVMIDIGKRYFGLGNIPRVKILHADAKQFVFHEVRKRSTYDLICIDLFSGRIIPDFVEKREFLIQVKKLLAPRGILLINYLREREYGEKSNTLEELLRTIFSDILDTKLFNNRFFRCQKIVVT